jgi:hypothetical protein
MHNIAKHLVAVVIALFGSVGLAQDAVENEANWVDEFLSSELQYDEAKIRGFKETVADMPEADLRAMLVRMRDARTVREDLQEVRLQGQRRSLQNIADARSVALSRPSFQAPYRQASGHRHLRYAPQFSSLNRGYVVWLNLR